MAGVVLVDTGPLVALFDPSDKDGPRCRAQLDKLEGVELITSEAVITETSDLLDFAPAAQAGLQRLLALGRPRVLAIEPAERPRLGDLLQKYADLPMDYADATLVVLAERLGCQRVFTLDRRDFGVYRLGRRKFELLPR